MLPVLIPRQIATRTIVHNTFAHTISSEGRQRRPQPESEGKEHTEGFNIPQQLFPKAKECNRNNQDPHGRGQDAPPESKKKPWISPPINPKLQQPSTESSPSVLVLLGASTNLTADDFRRLMPQGRHIENWKLPHGHITQIVPGRDMVTLEQLNFYFLIFASQHSAFTYQGHVTNIFKVVSSQTPSSVTSPLPPPRGYIINKIDAHAAMAAFTLVPPPQKMQLRQLRPPHSPIIDLIIKHGGYPALVNRRGRTAHEARLTLEGAQLTLATVRQILLTSAQSLGLSWNDEAEIVPRISKWEPQFNMSPLSRSQEAYDLAAKLDATSDTPKQDKAENSPKPNIRSAARIVYILGFETQGALQRFIAFWHRRHMCWEGVERKGIIEGDEPPIANVEHLW
ncbi:hypothetical protein K470DRAFT_299784 [Piedraia hortae CBS 480.64]|uniref:Uncharacterized protein n=1 Tax=Piedraia hortae CBS 480.64 TaxID=1314780 RepID=A0A6A7BZW4_9PEZI|nr:hypothetical protein K470DRAFT_299784 [Piedraia hortae CBS 480.64]